MEFRYRLSGQAFPHGRFDKSAHKDVWLYSSHALCLLQYFSLRHHDKVNGQSSHPQTKKLVVVS